MSTVSIVSIVSTVSTLIKQLHLMAKKETWWGRYYRPVIYFIVLLCVLIPMFVEKGLDIQVSKPTKGVYDAVQNIPRKRQETIKSVEQKILLEREKENANEEKITELEEHLARLKVHSNGVFLICFDFDPGTAPELAPMAETALRQAFKNGIIVLGNVGGTAVSAQLAQNIIERVANETRGMYEPKINGKDYLFFGFRPSPMMVYMQMGESIVSTYDTDYAGTDLDEIPIMKGIKNFEEIEMVLELTGYVGMPEVWLNVAKTKFNRDLALGMTSVSAADYFPYVQSKQIVGLLSGLRGAAEYEAISESDGIAVKRMQSQTWAHIFAIALIIIGNIEYFIKKLKK